MTSFILIFVLLAIFGKSFAVNWNGNNWALGCDFDGNDLSNQQSSGEQCGGICENTQGCTHFTWTTYNGGTCWLKTNGASKGKAIDTGDDSMVCGLVVDSINWNGNNWAFGCDFDGNDLSNQQSSGEQCGGICENTQGCTHFTWTTYNEGTCWLKTNGASKENAVYTGDNGMICGVNAQSPPGPNDSSFRIINRCSYTIWPGIQGKSRGNSNWQIPFKGGWELGPGQTTTFNLPTDFNAGRIWGRTNCVNQGNQFVCETGSCGFKECAFDGVQRGGQTPATLAEFTLNGAGNKDFFDVSLVDGYNLQMSIVVRKPNSDESGQFWCKNPTCLKDLNQICPDALRKYNSKGQVVGCLSACEKFKTDQYCCRGAHNTPQTCKSSQWPVNYPAIFKQACPSAYSYAYDDATSTFFCRNTGYDIIFC